MQHNSYLVLWLEGPMQSWGVNAKFNIRTTQDFPSKSAVLGMLLAAMGRIGKQKEILSEFDGKDMQVVAYSKSDKVSAQQSDFQVIGAKCDDKDEWQSLFIPRKGNGSKAMNVSGTKIIHKKYISDMSYAVLLEIPHKYKDEITKSIDAPVYSPYLGRKAYQPTDMIFINVVNNTKVAMHTISALVEEKKLKVVFKVLQGAIKGGEIVSINDQPICFGRKRKYKLRTVTII